MANVTMEAIGTPSMAVPAFDPIAMYKDPTRDNVRDYMSDAGDLIADTYAYMSNHKAEVLTASFAAVAIVAGGVAVKNGVGVEKASATPAVVTPEVVKTNEKGTEFTQTTTSTVLAGRASSSASAFAKINVFGNYRTVSKAKIQEAKRQGKCDVLSGEQAIKRGLRTQGYNGSGVSYALENRKSTFCDLNGDGKYDVRAECGNKAKGGRPQPAKARNVVWVNNFGKFNVGVRTKVSVEALSACRIEVSPGTYVSANARGFGEASITGKLSLRNAVKAGGTGVTEVDSHQRASLTATLRAEASAEAETDCKENKGGTVVENPPVVIVPPKDGTQGVGTTVPGPIGGEGAGGVPGNTEEGTLCYDAADLVNGDLDPATEGGVLWGTSKDQNDYCVGAAKPLQAKYSTKGISKYAY